MDEETRLEHQAADCRIRLLSIVFALVGLGVVMVYSASAMRATGFGCDLYFIEKQVMWLGIGVTGLLFFSLIDYRWLKKLWPFALVLTMGLLVAVRVPGIGTKVNGAYRWLRMGGQTMQPSELAKVLLVIAFAGILSRHEKMKFWKHTLPMLVLTGLFVGMIAIEPDLGTSALVLTVLVSVLIAAGAKIWHLIVVGIFALPPAVFVSYSKLAHVQTRVQAWLQGNTDGTGYQITMSKLALGSGGLWGVGLGKGPAKLYYLPEAHTDFILAIIGQELGLVGTLVVVGLFLALAFEGFRLAARTRDRFGALLTTGIMTIFTVQSLFNIAVVTASVPPKGIALPFISFGGSGLCVALAGVGIMVSVSRFGWQESQEEDYISVDCEVTHEHPSCAF